jgi:hypothetical protein
MAAQKIGQTFRYSTKNKSIISNGSEVIIFLMKPYNPAFCEKDEIG